MPIRDMILPEFDHEMANTRKTLERIPDNTFEWRPHDKSYTMQQLASHLAHMPSWTSFTLNDDSFDTAPTDGEQATTPQAKSTADLLDTFDKNVATAREAIASAEDAQLMPPWSLKKAGEVIFTMPRFAVLRSFILNHTIHHRAQLTVYLRLNDIPVPALYGPSADESMA
ncbi:DUF664 domain-containing protein [candidate division GN15 bacterium]|nr:DUF664 domain-containing protein [candidate division GN15 bacterium]